MINMHEYIMLVSGQRIYMFWGCDKRVKFLPTSQWFVLCAYVGRAAKADFCACAHTWVCCEVNPSISVHGFVVPIVFTLFFLVRCLCYSHEQCVTHGRMRMFRSVHALHVCTSTFIYTLLCIFVHSHVLCVNEYDMSKFCTCMYMCSTIIYCTLCGRHVVS